MGKAVEAVAGLGEGLAASAAFVALLSILDVIPRLAQVFSCGAGTAKYMESAIAAGLVSASVADGMGFSAGLGRGSETILALVGTGTGMFVGMLAAALAEVLDVLPVVGRRTGLATKIHVLVYALVAGKVAGSLAYWLGPQLW